MSASTGPARSRSSATSTTTTITTTTATTTSGGLRLRVARRGEGSVLVRAEGHVPFAPRVVAGVPGFATVVLVQTIAAPLAGDAFRIDVEVEDGASLELRTNAATVALRAREPATLDSRVHVGAGGRLVWRPEPVVLADGCDLRASLGLELAEGAVAVTREAVVLGRHGERGGAYSASIRCELGGEPLLHEAVEIDAGAALASSPAILAGARAFGSVALLGSVGEAVEPDELELAGPGRVLRVLATDASELARRLDRAEAAYRAFS